MAEQNNSDRLREIRQILKENVRFRELFGGGLLVLIGVYFGRATYPGKEWEFGMNLSTEMLGIAVAVLLIERFSQLRADSQGWRQLLGDAANTSNEITKSAVNQLQQKKLLEGDKGWLKQKHLERANLQEANLINANLTQAILTGANLQGANLIDANLMQAILTGANLQGADLFRATLRDANLRAADLHRAKSVFANLELAILIEANLQGADLRAADLHRAKLDFANLQEANLDKADLTHAVLTEANLQGATLTETTFDGSTRLPDGTIWTPYIDLGRFTDSEHPDFWRSDNDASPAYRGRTADD